MPEVTAIAPRRGRSALIWFLTNSAIGYLASFPLLMIVVFSYYVRAKVWGTVSSPFRDGEADVPLYFIAFTGIPLAVVAVLVNRALRRRLRLKGWPAVAFWVVTAAIMLAPFTFFFLAKPSVPEMFGKGLFW